MRCSLHYKPDQTWWLGWIILKFQTEVLSHLKKNQQILSVFLEAEWAQRKSLFRQPVMMISHNLGDRLRISQMRWHSRKERWCHCPNQAYWADWLDTFWSVYGNNVDIAMKCIAAKFKNCSIKTSSEKNSNVKNDLALWFNHSVLVCWHSFIAYLFASAIWKDLFRSVRGARFFMMLPTHTS